MNEGITCGRRCRKGPLLVFDSALELQESSGIPAQTPCSLSRWSQHYREHDRAEEGQRDVIKNNELAPWLAAKLKGILVRKYCIYCQCHK